MKKQTTATPIRVRRKPLITALEPRILLDGAAVATTAEMTTDVAYQDDAVHTEAAEQSVHFAAPAPSGSEPGNRREVAFVDSAVEEYQTLVDGLGDNVEVILIDGSDNGLEQMVAALQGQSGIDAIHLFSHGDVGELKLGTLTLNGDNLEANAELLSTLGESLTEAGDLMLYGCYVGADSEGQGFIDSVAALTQADVAASEDLTGAESLGGDWELEAVSGIVETSGLSVTGYNYSLTISGWSDQTYTEQQGEIALGNGITISNGDNYGTGYVRFEVTGGNQIEDILRLNSSNNPTAQDQVSVQGSNVYIGQGAGNALLKIGTIDSYYNGQGGRALQINFDNATIPGTNPVTNGDFSRAFSEGWNAYTGHIDLGATKFTFSNGKTWTIPEPGSQYYPSQTPGRDDNDRHPSSTSYGTYDNPVVQIDGGRLRLEESRMTTTSYGVVHGPAAYSDVFAAEKGMVLQFDWQANNINDDYHVVAYLMNADTGVAQLVFADYGTRGSGTEFVSVPTDGNYSFVFVSGTFDRTGGTLAGASMYIDNIRVEEAAVTDQVLSNLALQVMYQNTSDNPTTSKTVTLSTRNINGVTESDTMALTVTPVNDPSSLAGNAQLPTILEDQAINDGRTVSQLFGSLFSDVDNGDTLGGVFITSNPLAVDATNGVWEYQVAGSSTWHDIGAVSESDALLLAADTRIRFNPAADYNGTPDALSLKGVDQTRAGQGAGTTDGSRVTYDTTQATAESGLSSQTRTLSISVTSVNDIPVFDSTENSTSLTETSDVDAVIGDLTVQPGDVLTGQLQVSDIETDAALLALVIRGGTETSAGVWELSGRYGTLVLDTNNSNTWTYTPDKWDAINALRDGQVVTDTFQFKVSDGDGGVALQDFTITLNGVNDTPLLVNALPGQSFTGDGTWTWQVPANTFTDAEGTGLTYSAWVTEVDGVPVTPYEVTDVNTADGSATDWLTFDAVSRTLSGDPSATWADKDLTIEIRADDGAAQATSAFTLALTDTANNQAPVVVNEMNWASIDAQASSWTLQVPVDTFADPDSPTGLRYEAYIVNRDTGDRVLIGNSFDVPLSFDVANGTLSGNGSPIPFALIEIVAIDDKETGYSQESAATMFQLTVYDSNDPEPVISAEPKPMWVLGAQLIDGAGEGRYTVPANTFDIRGPEGSTVTYAAVQDGGESLPSWLIFDTATGTFSGNPPDGTDDLAIVVTATVTHDGSSVTSDPLALTLQVANPNDPIVLATAPLDDQTILADNELGLTFAAPFSDPDGVLTGYETNTGVPRVDGIEYEAVIVDENGVETPASDFGLTLAQDGKGNLTLNGNPPGGYAYLNIVIKGTEVNGGTTQSTSFTLFLNDANANSDQDVAAYSANDAGEVAVTGTATQGHTLTASTADDNGLTGTPSYQWQVSSDNGATWQDIARPESQAATLQLTQAEAGKQVRVQSFYTDDSGVFESPVSDAVAVADVDDEGAISVAGSPTVHSILSSTLTDADGLTKADPQYQWQVSTNGGSTWTNISGATYSTYQVTANEGGHQVRVQASYTDDMGNVETVTSTGKEIQLGAVAPVAVNDTASIREAGGTGNTSPATAPVNGNVLTNDTDRNDGDTKTIANLRTGNLEGFGSEASSGAGSFTLNGAYGQIVMSDDGSYTYTLDETNAAVQALAAGDALIEYFNYSVKDSTDLFDLGVLAITINGSNDAPEVTVTPADDMAEAVDASAQHLQVQGVVNFDDLDNDDALDLSFTQNNNMVWSGGSLDSALETLLWGGFEFSSANLTDRSAPDTVGWAYDVEGVDLDFLATGETITFSYTIKVTDSGGLEATDTLTLTITGSNDTPLVQVSSATDFIEASDAKAQALTQSGTVSFSDADKNHVLIDVGFASNNDIAWLRNDRTVVGAMPSGLAAQLVSAFSTGIQGASNNGQIAWEFDASALNLDFLNKDDTINFSYTVTATDDQGTSHSEVLTFTLVGTNDVPEFSDRQLTDDETIVQQGAVYNVEIASLFSDKDSTQSREDLDFTITGLPSGLVYNTETGVISGKPTQPGNFMITVTATDAEGASIQRSYEMVVTAVVQNETPANPGDSTPPSAPETDTQPIETPLSGMPDGLVNNTTTNTDTTANSGYLAPNTDTGLDAGEQNNELQSGANEPATEPNDGGVQAGGVTELVVLSEPGALVVQTQNPDGNTTVRASVDVSVTDSGEVVFTDVQQEAFSTVSLAVVSIDRTADNQLTIDIQDTSPNASSQLYSGSLSSGESLPSWISLDPATGSVTLTNPPAGQKEVSIRIQAVGTDGQMRVLELKLDLDELLKRTAETERTEPLEPVAFVPLSEQLEAELVAHEHYGDRLMALLQSA